MIPTVVAYDWAHKAHKKKFFDGIALISEDSLPNNCVIVTENIPAKEASLYLNKGHSIRRCSGNLIAEYRESLELEKTDEQDAKLILEYWKIHPEAFREYHLEPPVKVMYTVMKEIGKVRVSMSNRVWHSNDSRCQKVLKILEKAEMEAERAIRDEVENEPIYQWLVAKKGISTRLAGGLIAFVGDIARFDTISKLWKYAGLAVDNGQIQKKKKGQKAAWNHKLKSLCWLYADEFMKFGEQPYRRIYDEEKERQIGRGLKRGHAHNRALRKTAKIFLEHFWVKSRELKGLPTGKPYVISHLGHEHYIPATLEMEPNPGERAIPLL